MTDDAFSFVAHNDRPAPVVQVVGSHRGPDYGLAYLSCGHSLFLIDGEEPPAEGSTTPCEKCTWWPPIVSMGA